MNKFYFKKNGGFTIIETMISVSIFIIVMMIGIDSLLNANLLHQKSRDQRSVMDNLTFIMEDVSRNLRTGYNFRCVADVFEKTQASGVLGNTPQNCLNGGGAIVFENAFGSSKGGSIKGVLCDECTEDQWVYKIESAGGPDFNIYKSVDGAVNFIQLNPSEIKLDRASGFTVSGAGALDNQQPLVTIRLMGKITTKGKVTPFAIETSVSQRSSE